MEMISTARYKSYFNRWLTIVDYHDALARAAYLLVSSRAPIDHPLMRENSSGRWCILAIGSSRGLCGSYNTSVYRIVDVHVNRAKVLDKKLDLRVPDGKLVNVLHHHGTTPTKVYTGFEEVPSDAQIAQIADEVVGQYMAGLLDFFGIVYMRFFSVTGQQAQTLTVMPFTELVDDLTTRAKVIWPWELSFEDFFMSPSAPEIVEGLVKMAVHSSIKKCFMDAALSEHLSRMVAMRNATENAEDMIRNLTADYNRARQGTITRELLDIIGGTGALQ
jgi:F-type H+-transporting ATPase subunit gamma